MPVARRGLFLAGLTRTIAGLFFRRVELTGARHLSTGPAIYVANHGNGLVDPLLLIGWLPPGIRFLAKSTLWRHPVIGPFVRLASAIPVYRRQDAGSDLLRNRETFASAHEVLADGGGIGIFPEGGSFFEPGMLPLRSGAARIALGAEAAHGPLDTVIVPVGLNYEARDRFRSRVLIRVGPPLRAHEEAAIGRAGACGGDGRGGEDDPTGDRAAARHLTRRIDEALREVTLNFTSWEEAQLLKRAAEVYLRPSHGDSTAASLEGLFATSRAFADGYAELQSLWPEKTAAAAAGVRRYERLLRVLGVDDRQLIAEYPPHVVMRYVGRTVLALVVWLPVATLGTVLNGLAYKLPGWIVSPLSIPVSDRATYKVFLGLFLFPAGWFLETWLAGRWLGPGWAMATALAAPVSGYVALRYSERGRQLLREARAYRTLLSPGRAVAAARTLRRELLAQVDELVNLYQERSR